MNENQIIDLVERAITLSDINPNRFDAEARDRFHNQIMVLLVRDDELFTDVFNMSKGDLDIRNVVRELNFAYTLQLTMKNDEFRHANMGALQRAFGSAGDYAIDAIVGAVSLTVLSHLDDWMGLWKRAAA